MAGGSVVVPIVSRYAALPICAAVGLSSLGVGGALCVLVVVGGASYAGNSGGEWAGELLGDKIYERTSE
ncbi:hypothetical protein D9M71_136970 [compost metagenome]